MYTYKAKVLRWIDGDTLLVEVDLGFYVKVVERLRLQRINAPELTSKVPYQVRLAKSARRHAKSICPVGASVIVQTKRDGKDRYARYLAEVICNDINVSDYLLQLGVVDRWK